MVTYFNKKDMTSFGNYLLSDERKKRVEESPSTFPLEERLKNVSHADFENWKESQKNSE